MGKKTRDQTFLLDEGREIDTSSLDTQVALRNSVSSFYTAMKYIWFKTLLSFLSYLL